MVKQKFDDLAIYDLNGETQQVLFSEIQNLFVEKNTEIIYFVINQKLYGIICLGDCLRSSNKHYININTKFTKITNWNLMQAKNILLNNSNINKIPVVNEDDFLLGAYSRWDDELTMKHFISEDIMMSLIERISENRKVYLVNTKNVPSIRIKAFVDSKTVQVIDRFEIENYFNERAIFIFETEDEKRAWECYDRKRNPNYLTWSQLYKKSMRIDTGELELTLTALKQEGIKIFLYGNYNENCELQKACSLIISKQINQSKDEFWKNFLEEFYTESYCEKIASMRFEHRNMKGVRILQDISSELLNIENGIRKTYYLPDKYVGTIWFFGPCISVGAFVEDRNTIESYLQKILLEKGFSYRVINCGAWEDVNRVLMNFVRFKKGDIVVVYTGGSRYEYFSNVSLEDIYVQHNIPLRWTKGHLHHCNHRVNELIANELAKKITPGLVSFKGVAEQRDEDVYDIKAVKSRLIIETYLNIYFADFVKEDNRKIGAIVMNCNPFTNGHRYLIEEAAEQADLLIVFVVQEDKSLFSFAERFEMVINGTCDLANVKVVPSGRYILSHITFPEYFGKVQSEDLEIDIEYDIRLWGECVASVLGIEYRFVGEEKEDTVTAAYNAAMKRILPDYSVNVIEFPRKEIRGHCISASYVRELLEQGDVEAALSFVPLSTRKVIEKQL